MNGTFTCQDEQRIIQIQDLIEACPSVAERVMSSMEQHQQEPSAAQYEITMH